MYAETDLMALLRRLSPRLRDGAYVYTIVSEAIPPGAAPVVFVREDEGLTLILPQRQADDHLFVPHARADDAVRTPGGPRCHQLSIRQPGVVR